MPQPDEPEESTPTTDSDIPRPSRLARLKRVPPLRVAVWVVVGGIGLFLIAEGIVGILTKAR